MFQCNKTKVFSFEYFPPLFLISSSEWKIISITSYGPNTVNNLIVLATKIVEKVSKLYILSLKHSRYRPVHYHFWKSLFKPSFFRLFSASSAVFKIDFVKIFKKSFNVHIQVRFVATFLPLPFLLFQFFSLQLPGWTVLI